CHTKGERQMFRVSPSNPWASKAALFIALLQTACSGGADASSSDSNIISPKGTDNPGQLLVELPQGVDPASLTTGWTPNFELGKPATVPPGKTCVKVKSLEDCNVIVESNKTTKYQLAVLSFKPNDFPTYGLDVGKMRFDGAQMTISNNGEADKNHEE